MNEADIQKKFITILQNKKIDFFRIGNRGFKGKGSSSKSYGLWGEGVPCDKYFPDVIFPFNGSLYMVEFGIKNTNPERKAKQAERANHWLDNCKSEYWLIKEPKDVLEFFRFLP